MSSNEREQTVVHHFDSFAIEQSTVELLQSMVTEQTLGLKFVPLRSLVRSTRELLEATASHHMAEYIGSREIGNPHAVIWQPSPIDDDWFKRLAEERNSAKRILLTYEGCSSLVDESDVEDDKDELERFATSVIRIPTDNCAEKIFRILRK